MRGWQVVLGLAILLGSPVVQLKSVTAQESLWRRFTSQRGGFSVVMPGTPKERKEGNLTLFEVIRDDESVRYSVGYLDLPVAPGNDRKLQNEVYEGVRRGAEKDQAELLSFRTIRLGNFPGREMNFKLPDEMGAKWRVYLVNRRAYFVSVTTTQENQERGLATSIDVFLNSFRLVGKR
ncbi:hypothetical protein [Leptolyngbya sp. NIES-2104]|uniref:hypothetical protein n=1 Tax=Leptolyngbya sp. NIES-2104 TaxID=1552121 RepID=UPI0006EC9D12|nr:hypothetical protein [Leptolyngbya sp. NIES-2104]GAP99366.1 hypothetical protein NIES2104_59270 [Leptolyngbya sp. NIES-2104]